MQPDSQFVDNYVAAVQDEQRIESHDLWVELRLARDFMRNTKASFRAGAAALLLLVAVLYGHVNPWGLAAWAGLCAVFLTYRYLMVKSFEPFLHQAALADAPLGIERFFKQHGWGWPVSAFLFAAPMFLYYERAPAVNQYVSMMILVGMGSLGASLMAANLKCQQRFSHALCSTAMLAVFVHWLDWLPNAPTPISVIFLLLIALFWILIVYLGKHLHALQRSSYSAQYGHEELIRSLRQQTQAATEAVSMKNNLLASAAHDLRQPVHALAFYADWLRHEPELAASVIPKILAATDSVNTLFNSLFDFAHIETGAIKIDLQDVDIAPLIEDLVVQFAPAADSKGLSLRARPVEAIVRSDPVLLRRIVANLLANAIRYTDQGGVMIAARLMGGKLWLEISDSGAGIAPEHLPHVFKEFYRAPGHEGTADSFGLGLAIVQRLCRALGHTVSLRSVLGKGTRGRLEIKLAEGQAAEASSKPMTLEDEQKIYTQIMPRERAQ